MLLPTGDQRRDTCGDGRALSTLLSMHAYLSDEALQAGLRTTCLLHVASEENATLGLLHSLICCCCLREWLGSCEGQQNTGLRNRVEVLLSLM